MKPKPVEATVLYEQDFVQWLEGQAIALREGRLSDVDAANVAEELEGLARSDRRELRSRLKVLMKHLLKMELQPERACDSWRSTISEQSTWIDGLFETSPSLRRELAEAMERQYPRARREAADETGLSLELFPEELSDVLRQQVLERIDF